MLHPLHPNSYTLKMFKKIIVKALLITLAFIVMSCNANDLFIDDIKAYYVYDETGSIMINVGFSANVSKDDVLFLTITSPDGLLTWSDVCSSGADSDKTYYTIGDIVLPYKISGEWTAEIARADKTKKVTFSLSEPEEFVMPEALESLYLHKVNGNVYTLRAPKIQKNDVIYIFARNNVKQVTENIIPIVGESEKSIAVNFKSSALVFSMIGDDGILYRKKIII